MAMNELGIPEITPADEVALRLQAVAEVLGDSTEEARNARDISLVGNITLQGLLDKKEHAQRVSRFITDCLRAIDIPVLQRFSGREADAVSSVSQFAALKSTILWLDRNLGYSGKYAEYNLGEPSYVVVGRRPSAVVHSLMGAYATSEILLLDSDSISSNNPPGDSSLDVVRVYDHEFDAMQLQMEQSRLQLDPDELNASFSKKTRSYTFGRSNGVLPVVSNVTSSRMHRPVRIPRGIKPDDQPRYVFSRMHQLRVTHVPYVFVNKENRGKLNFSSALDPNAIHEFESGYTPELIKAFNMGEYIGELAVRFDKTDKVAELAEKFLADEYGDGPHEDTDDKPIKVIAAKVQAAHRYLTTKNEKRSTEQ